MVVQCVSNHESVIDVVQLCEDRGVGRGRADRLLHEYTEAAAQQIRRKGGLHAARQRHHNEIDIPGAQTIRGVEHLRSDPVSEPGRLRTRVDQSDHLRAASMEGPYMAASGPPCGADDGDTCRVCHPFTPPEVRPAMNQRWKAAKMASTGMKATTMKVAMAAIPGRMRGMTMRQRICGREHPSTAAASSISTGTFSMKLRRNRMVCPQMIAVYTTISMG